MKANRSLITILWIWILLLSLSCSRSAPQDLKRLPMPTPEEVALVDGVPFTLADFLTIRSNLHNPSSETAYWIGVGSLAVRREAANQGRKLGLLESSRLTRYAAGELSVIEAEADLRLFYPEKKNLPTPGEVKEMVNQLIERSWVQKGLIPISRI